MPEALAAASRAACERVDTRDPAGPYRNGTGDAANVADDRATSDVRFAQPTNRFPLNIRYLTRNSLVVIGMYP